MQTSETYIRSQNFDCFELEDKEFRDKILPFQEECKDYNFFLLLENIRAEAWGYKPLSLIKYSFGQCIAKSISMIKIAKVNIPL